MPALLNGHEPDRHSAGQRSDDVGYLHRQIAHGLRILTGADTAFTHGGVLVGNLLNKRCSFRRNTQLCRFVLQQLGSGQVHGLGLLAQPVDELFFGGRSLGFCLCGFPGCSRFLAPGIGRGMSGFFHLQAQFVQA